MIGSVHTLGQKFRVAVLSILALSLLVSWPYLLNHHHHGDFEVATHCAVCLFASAHVVATPEPVHATLDPTLIGRIQTADEPLVPSLSVRTPCGRAPPTA